MTDNMSLNPPAAFSTIPAYRGLINIVFDRMLTGPSGNIQKAAFEVQSTMAPLGLGSPTANGDANPAEVIYDLTPYPDRSILRAVVGVDDETGTRGSVTFEVHVDAPDGGWRKLHATRLLAGGGDVKALTIDLSDAQKLRLVVTDAGDHHGSDHAVWANARLEAKQ